MMLVLALAFVVLPLGSRRLKSNKLALAVVVAIPLVALGLYTLLGSGGGTMSAAPRHAAADGKAAQRAALGSVQSMLAGLEARLKDNPDDAKGWLLLAKSYQYLGRSADASVAYERAGALGMSDPKLAASLQPDTPSIRGHVSLADDAAATLQEGDTLFIFAKQSADDRMPVAALRRPATGLPLDFTLTDREVIVPGGRLADYDELRVMAQISPSGNASDKSGGRAAWSEPVSPRSGKRVELTISAAAEPQP